MKKLIDTKSGQILASGVPIRLHVRTEVHMARKIWHAGMGIFIVICLHLLTYRTSVILLTSALVLISIAEFVRLKSRKWNRFAVTLLGPIMRQHEIGKMSTVVLYVVGTLVCVAFFHKSLASLAVLYLAIGDPVASLVGIKWGHLGFRLKSGKSVVGSIAGVAVCALAGLIYLNLVSGNDAEIDNVSNQLLLFGALIGGLSELIPVRVDDNLVIPIVSVIGLRLVLEFAM